MKQKVDERLAARKLRELGYSVNEIVREIGTAKSSVSLWVRNIQLAEKSRARLLTKIKTGQLAAAESRRKHTQDIIDGYRRTARGEVSNTTIDPTLGKIICSLLYWCEGAKDHFNGVRFTNSDPKLMGAFLTLLRRSFPIDEGKLRIGLHLHEYHTIGEQINFWSNVTGVPHKQFLKPYQKPHTGRRMRRGYPGCATVYYYSNATARQLLATAEIFLHHLGA